MTHRRIASAVLLAGLAGLLAGCVPPVDLPDLTDIVVNAGTLRAEYEANEVAADLKYADKIIRVQGYVESIGRNLADMIYVILVGAPGGDEGVQCYFADEDAPAVALLSNGDYVTVAGQCLENSLFYVQFVAASIE